MLLSDYLKYCAAQLQTKYSPTELAEMAAFAMMFVPPHDFKLVDEKFHELDEIHQDLFCRMTEVLKDCALAVQNSN